MSTAIHFTTTTNSSTTGSTSAATISQNPTHNEVELARTLKIDDGYRAATLLICDGRFEAYIEVNDSDEDGNPIEWYVSSIKRFVAPGISSYLSKTEMERYQIKDVQPTREAAIAAATAGIAILIDEEIEALQDGRKELYRIDAANPVKLGEVADMREHGAVAQILKHEPIDLYMARREAENATASPAAA